MSNYSVIFKTRTQELVVYESISAHNSMEALTIAARKFVRLGYTADDMIDAKVDHID